MTERKRNLRPVREVTAPSLQFRTIHGYKRAFRIAGSGPAILLIHGIGDNSTTWTGIHAKLAQRFTVIAPDLLGHGRSDKPRADYSIAAYANGMRDLLSVLDIERVTIIGHSLGGGVAMQFAYQFPQLVDRLILVGAGGVTKDVNVVFRLASLPMGAEALALLRLPMVLPTVQLAGKVLGMALGSTALGQDLPNVLRILDDLPEPTASSAFTRTLRAVVDWRGQIVTMLDRCYLTQAIPVQIIWAVEMPWSRFATPKWHMRPCRDPSSRSSRDPDISRSTTTPLVLSTSSCASSTAPSLPNTIKRRFGNCCAPAAVNEPFRTRPTPAWRCSAPWVLTNAAPPDQPYADA